MTVYRSPRGKWLVEVNYRHASGRVERVRRTSPVQTMAGAKKYELQLRASLLEGPAPAEAPTLEKFAKDYLAYSKTNNRPRWYREKDAMLRRSVLPFFGRMALDEIGFRELERYKSKRTGEGRHPKTVNDECSLVVAVLRYAVKCGVLATAPVYERLKTPPSDFDFLDFDELPRLVGAADAGWSDMILFAARTGLRSGELRAVQFPRDFAGGDVVVREALDDKGVRTPPKSGRSRRVPLSADALAAVSRCRHLRGPYLWCNEDGRPYTHRQLERPLHRACRKAGLREIGWHDLRHTFASHLVMSGASLKAVQELGGWSDIKMVLRYAHLSPDVRRDAVQGLDRSARARKVDEG